MFARMSLFQVHVVRLHLEMLEKGRGFIPVKRNMQPTAGCCNVQLVFPVAQQQSVLIPLF